MEDDDVDSSEVQAPPFLAHLGLDGQADERAIRRAYAQRLKRIDQVHEAQAFQDLREAYETALRWCAWQRQRAAEREAEQAVEPAVPVEVTLELVRPADVSPAEPASPPSDALPESSTVPAQLAADGGRAVFEAPPDPEVLAEAVFGRFVARRDQGFASEDEAQQALDHALADGRLVNLEARAMFEWRVACLLAEGWRPGHEFVFSPACKTFHWEQERRALAVFGRVGALLNAAIQERLMFFGQGPLDFNAQRQLIQRLRRDTMPDTSELIRSVPTLRMLMQRYPQWLRMVSSQENFVRWNEAFEAVPVGPQEARRRQSVERQAAAAPAPARVPANRKSPKRASSFSMWGLGLALFFVIHLMSGLSQDSSGKFHFSTSSPSWVPPTATTPASPAPVPEFTPLFDVSPTEPVAVSGNVVASRKATQASPAVAAAVGRAASASRADGHEGATGQAHVEKPMPITIEDLRERRKLHEIGTSLPELPGSVLTSPDPGASSN